MNDLKDYEKDFPEFMVYKQKELDTVVVKVKDIIGGNPYASKNYYEDWTPKDIEYNLRYQGVEGFVKSVMNKKTKIKNLGYIHLFKIYSKKHDKHVFYVCGDGHRRVSVANALKIEKIYAKATQLLNDI